MRILIVPFIANHESSASYFITKNIADLFVMEGHQVAIATNKENRFHHISFYPTKTPIPPFSFHNLPNKNYEQWLYTTGSLSSKYLEEDYRDLSKIYKQCNPDLIISFDRPAANVLARKKHIPIWTIVHADMYKSSNVDKKCMYGINTLLSNKGLEQEYKLTSLYAKSDLRIGFGPIEVQPFHIKDNVTRIGVTSIYPPKITRTNRVCIFLSSLSLSSSKIRRIILEAFEGAPYAVYACFHGSHQETIQNIHFLQNAKAELLPGSLACIHDGNDFYMNQCLARSIQQLIIYDHSYMRYANAKSVQRNQCGIAMEESDFIMSKLYEQYRLLVTDDTYYYHTQAMKQFTLQEGDLTKLLGFLHHL